MCHPVQYLLSEQTEPVANSEIIFEYKIDARELKIIKFLVLGLGIARTFIVHLVRIGHDIASLS